MSTLSNPRRTRLQPEARRAQLLQCALSAFAEHGIARATHSHVADQAGVSVPTVHAYFRTREDLVAAVLAHVEAYLDTLPERLGRIQSPYDALIDLGQAFAREAETDPDTIKIWLDWSTGVSLDVWPNYLRVLGRLHDAVEKLLVRAKREGSVPKDLHVKAAARNYIGGGHTVALMVFAGVSKREIDLSTEEMVNGIFRGLRT